MHLPLSLALVFSLTPPLPSRYLRFLAFFFALAAWSPSQATGPSSQSSADGAGSSPRLFLSLALPAGTVVVAASSPPPLLLSRLAAPPFTLFASAAGCDDEGTPFFDARASVVPSSARVLSLPEANSC